MAESTSENFWEVVEPRAVTAAMQTTAIRATRRAYSMRLAPRSLSIRLLIQAPRNQPVCGDHLVGLPS